MISWLVLDNCPQKLWVWKLAVLFCLNSLPNDPTHSNSCIHPMLTLASTNKVLFLLPILITPKSNNHSLPQHYGKRLIAFLVSFCQVCLCDVGQSPPEKKPEHLMHVRQCSISQYFQVCFATNQASVHGGGN